MNLRKSPRAIVGLIAPLQVVVLFISVFFYRNYKFESFNDQLMKDSLYSISYSYVMEHISENIISVSNKKKISNDIQIGLKQCRNDILENKLPLKIYKEFVLPPIVDKGDEFDNWREACIKEFNFVDKDESIYIICDTINRYLARDFTFTAKGNPSAKSWKDYRNNPYGDCYDMAKLVLYPLRALGIPASIDFVISWGNSNGRHSWNVIYYQGKMVPFMGLESSTKYYPFMNNRYPAKIFRKTFTVNKEYEELKQMAGEKLKFQLFADLKFIDVTSEYFPTENIELIVPESNNKVLFLSVFSNNHWIPIDASKLYHNNKVLFKNMKRGMLYALTDYRYKTLLPPFILTDLNEKKFLEKDTECINIRYELSKKSLEKYCNEDHYFWLYYYDKDRGWIKISKAKRIGQAITFCEVPSNCLYIVKDSQEEVIGRCFIYDNNKCTEL